MDKPKDIQLTPEQAKKRILKESNGKRYVLLTTKKKIKVKKSISERELIQWIIKHFRPKRKKAKKDNSILNVPKNLPKNLPSKFFADNVYNANVQRFDKLQNDLEEAKKAALPVALPAVPALPALPAAEDLALPDSKTVRIKGIEYNTDDLVNKFNQKALEAEQGKKDSKYYSKMAAEARKAEYKLKTEKEIEELEKEVAALEKNAEEYASSEWQKFNKQTKAELLDILTDKQIYMREHEKLTKGALQQLLIDNGFAKSKDQMKEEKLHDVDQINDEIVRLKNSITEKAEEVDEDDGSSSGYVSEADTKQSMSDYIGDFDGSGRKKAGLYDVQIDDAMKAYPDYLGSFAIDELDSLVKKIKNGRWGAIINLSKRADGGSHWVSLFGDGRPEGSLSIEYYDSFGDEAPQEVIDELPRIVKAMKAPGYLKFKENLIQKQDVKSSNCGYFAMSFLIDRFRGKPFSDCSGYDDHLKGERNIEEFKKKLNIRPFPYVDGDGIKEIYENIRDRVVGFFTGRTKPPPAIRKLLDENSKSNFLGNEPILSLTVARSPVNGVIQGILNAVSSGQVEENRKKLNYDDIYHLFLIVKTAKKEFTLERNQTVSVGSARRGDEEMPVDLKGKSISFGEFLTNGAKGKSKFWQYDPVSNNCQMFVKDLLNGSGLLTPELNSFIIQDAAKLLEQSPLTQKLAQTVTDFGHRLDILINGAGVEKKGKKKKKAKF